ncbi:MAG: hypothetical protein SGJ20_09520 [Planctomycetota bacterium]|nr:hypothetical protein [Planctomycetota bacterium]
MIRRIKNLFDVGKCVGTPGAVNAMRAAGQEAKVFLDRHITGDWGDVSEHDARVNEDSLITGDSIHSVYHTSAGVKLIVITEPDRSSTCIMLPEEN